MITIFKYALNIVLAIIFCIVILLGVIIFGHLKPSIIESFHMIIEKNKKDAIQRGK